MATGTVYRPVRQIRAGKTHPGPNNDDPGPKITAARATAIVRLIRRGYDRHRHGPEMAGTARYASTHRDGSDRKMHRRPI